MSLLQFENVDSYYGYAKILHGVSFAVDRGERVALLGRNGVGKTTVVNTLCGVAQARAGRISIGEEVIASPRLYHAARNGIAIVPQGRRIIPTLTVEENLIVGQAGSRGGEWNARGIYELFPILEEKRNNLGTSLSGGQQQMLAIGRALMANPDLLILDEPSEGLAPVIIDELAGLLNKLAESGTGIFLIEQNISLIRRVTKRCYILSKGQVVESGPLAQWSKQELQKHIVV